MTRKPWEQLENEPDAAYVRFLAYRNLGPGRSIERAHRTVEKSSKSQGVSGQWYSDSTTYNWVVRVKAWDIYNLETYGQEVVINFMEVLRLATEQTLASLQTTKPDGWLSILETIQTLGNYVTPEAIAAVQSARDRIESGGTESKRLAGSHNTTES